MFPRAARPERPERLSPLRAPASGRRALSARARLLPLLLVAAFAGCGGGDEPGGETTRELPDLSAPKVETAPEVTTPAEQPTTTTVDPRTETLPGEGPEPAPEEPPADTPENDAPPPEDTPAERFEEYCNENPGACG